MSSRRPAARSAMEVVEAAVDDDARLHPSSPRPNKRSSRRSGERRRFRSPNPSPGPRDDSGYAPSRKSERKRKQRAFADTASLLPVSSLGGGGTGGHGAFQKLWTNADEVALLTGAVSFRARTGVAPRLPDMGPFFQSLRGSISSHLHQAKVYYKLKRIKSKFLHSTPAAASSSHERRVRELCEQLWGAELAPPVEVDADAEEAEERDAEDGYTGEDLGAAVRLPVVTEVLGEYWKKNGRVLSGVSLEKGLELLGEEEGRVVEAKWKRQLEAEMRTQGRRHDLAKEVYALLVDAIRGLGP
ncbi:hypothetical protein GUJ93_ZPchr0006g45756 [Zizania palustris]|uniref:Glabrous enhancer-binding protein-like DBD domain-containing protein n=1 Tax=Zizania palustris TaxID=103762 RepID=A0A8J5SNC7_ZIZPA|nr:hypothetical protein GUJ93_ZPchr0006g45756 [Zizania palustris]